MSELFPLDAVFMESPRLRWLKKHGVTIEHCPGFDGEESPETGETCYPYYVWLNAEPEKKYGHYSADDALVELAKAKGLKLWNEE